MNFRCRFKAALVGLALLTSTFSALLPGSGAKGLVAQAQPEQSANKLKQNYRETYKERKIVIKSANDGTRLYLDKKLVDTVQDPVSGKYTTYLLPFGDYTSLLDLAKEMIDLGVVVPTKPSDLDGEL